VLQVDGYAGYHGHLRGSLLMGMASDVVALPREPDTLIEIIVELRDENGKLRAMLKRLRRTLFGPYRSGSAPMQDNSRSRWGAPGTTCSAGSSLSWIRRRMT
jgi:hypothetical protein